VREFLSCIAALIITTLTHSGPSYGQTQSELNQQARDEFLKADQRLNAVFSSLIAKASAAGKASLRDAEKTSIRFRDQDAPSRPWDRLVVPFIRWLSANANPA
jgi:uncharacterized protein YecT (DUF1311 family)